MLVTHMKTRGESAVPEKRKRRVNRRPRRSLPTVHTLDCVPALKAIGEETRVRIVELLLDRPLTVEAIANALGVSQYNVSKHLRILRSADLLIVEKRGRHRLYGLPTAINRKGDADDCVLDLGCCCFQFAQRPASARATGKRSALKGTLVRFPSPRPPKPD